MKISTKGRYALRMMLDLATHQGDGYVALKDIAQRQEISKKYLEQIVPMLGKSNILRTTRGYQGGYRLARAPQDYTVGEILRLTEGGLAPVACLDQHPNPCPRCGECATLPMWEGLERVICNYLDGITSGYLVLPEKPACEFYVFHSFRPSRRNTLLIIYQFCIFRLPSVEIRVTMVLRHVVIPQRELTCRVRSLAPGARPPFTSRIDRRS